MRPYLRAAVALVAAVSASIALPASAAPLGEYTVYDLGTGTLSAGDLASGRDGNMWFTDNGTNSIGVITPAGKVTSYPLPSSAIAPSGAGLFAIAAGPDGNMWFTAFYGNVIGRITPAGAITTYPVPTANAMPYGITAGPDGNMWFTMDMVNAIGRITPSGTITQFPIPAPGSTGTTAITASSKCVMCAYLITAGPEDSLWFTIPQANLVGRMTVDGAVTTFPVTTAPPPSPSGDPATIADITAGPDGNLWITQFAAGKVSRMTPTGTVTDYAMPSTASSPSSISPGPGDTLWVTLIGTQSLARLTVPTDGGPASVASYPLPTPGSVPGGVATGPDGSAWFTNLVVPQAPAAYAQQVGRIGTGVGPILTAKIASTGKPKVGAPLTCTPASSAGWAERQVQYRWLRDGKPIATGLRKTFTPRARDKGRSISCRVSITYAGALNQLGATSRAVKITG